jgi:shikimate dehydrogenase
MQEATVLSDPIAENEAAASFAVFGNPIKHSKSPVIQRAFAAQFDQDIQYRAVRVEEPAFEEAVRRFFEAGGAGLNVTVPFKERAFQMADEASDRATRAKAANVLMLTEDGRLRADNTDGVGMIRDMVVNHGWQVGGRRTLILGAGGAVRGVLQPLLKERPGLVFVANRTASRAQALAAEFADLDVPISGGGFADIPGQPWDLIINGTSAGLSDEVPELPPIALSDRCSCYDMIYGGEPTAFMRWAANHAAWAVSDGLGMLVEQAAESYWLWRQKRPETRPMIQQVRGLLTD